MSPANMWMLPVLLGHELEARVLQLVPALPRWLLMRCSFFRNNNVKGHYAFKEETAMVEFGYQPKDEYVPLGKVSSLPSLLGVTPLSWVLGCVLERTLLGC